MATHRGEAATRLHPYTGGRHKRLIVARWGVGDAASEAQCTMPVTPCPACTPVEYSQTTTWKSSVALVSGNRC